MLVLTRRLGESIVIDGDIKVTVIAVQGDKVRLGIAAPASIPVDREEVHRRRLEAAVGPHRLGRSADPLTETPAPGRLDRLMLSGRRSSS
jgi:carbon storage regulator